MSEFYFSEEGELVLLESGHHSWPYADRLVERHSPVDVRTLWRLTNKRRIAIERAAQSEGPRRTAAQAIMAAMAARA